MERSKFADSSVTKSGVVVAYAFRVMQLPIGVFGVAITTVTLQALSRAAIGGISEEFRPTLEKGLRLVAFLAEPIIRVMFERINFHAIKRIQTATALRAYVYGLVFYA